MGCRSCLRHLSEWKNPLIVVLLPILLLPIPIQGNTSVARCAYAVIIIGTYWVLEVMPIAVTSLIPVFLFPLLGIMPAADVCSYYANDTLMLFFGSLVVAVAVEQWDLHKRIALRALTLVGPEPRWLMLGIMLPTWFLSMWMSNTATTAMMIPILNAILQQIKVVRDKVNMEEKCEMPNGNSNHLSSEETNDVNIDFEMDDFIPPNTPLRVNPRVKDGMQGMHMKDEISQEHVSESKDEDLEFKKLAKTFALCTAYAANAGGVATLTGTPPNIIFKGQADIKFQDYGGDSGINFANWMVAGIPLSLTVFLFTWLWMQIYCLGKNCLCCIKEKDSYEMVKLHLRSEYRGLGRMTFAEWVVLADFVILALLWITRNPQFVPGWASLFHEKYVKDSTAAIFMSVILFILPSKAPRPCWRSEDVMIPTEQFSSMEKVIREADIERRNYVPILTWRVVNEKMAWGVLILMGGGFALAEGCSRSGLSKWMSDQLIVFGVLEPWMIAAILSFLVAGITNITSNAATATLFLPIVGDLAITLGINPLYFMIPCAVSASFAYLLPVGTPPNAIVFSTGYLTISDMMKAGSMINVVSVIILQIALNTFIAPVFDLYTFPSAFQNNTKSPIEVALNMTTGGSYNTSLT